MGPARSGPTGNTIPIHITVPQKADGDWRSSFRLEGGDVEIPPGWLIVVEGKGNKYRLIPMKSVVRAALL